MKKRILAALILFLSLSSVFGVTAVAYTEGEAVSVSNEINELLEDFSDTIPMESGVSLEENDLLSCIGFDKILGSVIEVVKGEGADVVKFFFTVLGFAILSVASGLLSYGSAAERSVGVGVMVIASVSVYPSLYSLFYSVGESLEAISSFFGAALPVMTAITTATGSVKTAAVQAANMNVALGIVGAVSVRLLLPLSFALLAIALVSSFGDGAVSTVGKGIKSLFTFGLGIVTAISSAAVSLQTVIASASDTASLRAARYAASGLIPVVGSSVSSALSTLAGGLAYAKSTVGAAAIVVILVLSMTPLFSLLLYRAVFSIAVSFLEYLGNSVGSRCFSAYRIAIDSVISVYVMSTLVCIIQLILFMKGGGATL